MTQHNVCSFYCFNDGQTAFLSCYTHNPKSSKLLDKMGLKVI